MKPAVRAILYVIFALAGAMVAVLAGSVWLVRMENARVVASGGTPDDRNLGLPILIAAWMVPETVIGTGIGVLLAWLLFRRCGADTQ